MKSNLTNYEPTGREECLCGSGKRFKNCCKNLYLKKKLDGFALYNKGEYSKALRATRAHITWYRLCHQAHTVPYVASGNEKAFELLTLDIEALSELIGLLVSCYRRCGLNNDIPTLLKKHEDAVDDARWDLKLVYRRCEYFYLFQQDKESAIVILQPYDWQTIDDVDLLSIYLDINSEKLNQADVISLAEKIILNTKSPSYLLHYQCLIGIQYCLLSDLAKGIPYIKNAIKTYEEVIPEERSAYGRHILSMAYQNLGQLSKDVGSLEMSLDLLQKELELESSYSNSGLAQLWFDIGDCYFHLGQLEESVTSFRKSAEYLPSGITNVFLSKTYIALHEFEMGRELLNSVDVSSLSDANLLDMAFTKCSLAIQSHDHDDINQGLESIRSIHTRDPLFQSVVQELIVELYELKKDDFSTTHAESALMKFNRCVSLKPNIFGIGVDINAIIDNFASKKL